MRKFLNENLTVTKELQSTTDFMDFRYAEILLNFAEAVVEKGETDGNLLDMAKKGLNDLRKRAAHTTEVDLTLDNVLRERRIELAFENKGYWDLINDIFQRARHPDSHGPQQQGGRLSGRAGFQSAGT